MFKSIIFSRLGKQNKYAMTQLTAEEKRLRRELDYKNNRSAKKQAARKYTEEQKEHNKKRHLVWVAENKDKINQRKHLYYKENKEKVCEKRRQYYDKNKDIILGKSKDVREVMYNVGKLKNFVEFINNFEYDIYQ